MNKEKKTPKKKRKKKRKCLPSSFIERKLSMKKASLHLLLRSCHTQCHIARVLKKEVKEKLANQTEHSPAPLLVLPEKYTDIETKLMLVHDSVYSELCKEELEPKSKSVA